MNKIYTGILSAVCLDGSPPAYHYAKGFGEGASNWMVYLEGGGWCKSEDTCYSKVQNQGPGMGNSYKKGNQTAFDGILSPSQTMNPNVKIHRRGARVFKAIMEDLLAKGMRNANNAILAGNSAGGLATILHCDGFRALIPNAARLKCIADAALFIRGKDLPGAADKRELSFATIVAFHGIDNFLPKSCTSKMDPGLCIFPENLLGDIQTPIFLLNSAFDSLQVSSCFFQNLLLELNSYILCIHFRTTLLKTIPEDHSSSRGIFIDSCYYHDQIYFNPKWIGPTSPKLNNKTMSEAVGDWYFDRSSFQEIDMENDFPRDCTRDT
ncbi:hypothetical protein RD792_006081 [Penstemon davidsonii]|uniref:Pectin acetylesterase n=1 Tax=Penstemon davidsonii TaxID=160366 RepID=A0ABR0DEE9_9LAMI|nr:hypothetical protein RD792_006081 [Penstemon davidsonii]